jgi:heme A synthase
MFLAFHGQKGNAVNELQTRHRHDVPMAWIKVLAIGTLVSTMGLIVLGSAVRVTNSGMGCRGWPLCTGAQGSISSFHPVMEESHRLLASLVTILIVALALCVRRNALATHLHGPSLVAVGVIILQIVLGAITVFANNAPFTVALHLLTAAMFLGVVSVVAVAAFLPPEVSWSLRRGPTRLAWTAVIGLYLVVISGSVVVNAGAQSACASWPVCLHSPAQSSLLIVQMLHRSIVLVGSILVVVFMASILRARRASRAERTLSMIALGLLGVQIAVGAMSAIWSAHSELADVHLALASILWSCVVAVFALSARGAGDPSSAPLHQHVPPHHVDA